MPPGKTTLFVYSLITVKLNQIYHEKPRMGIDMQAPEDIDFENECNVIRQERANYSVWRGHLMGLKVFDWLSTAFLFAGFAALILVPFTTISLLQATCLFVIQHTLSLTDLDRAEAVFKGIAEDMANIRANINLIRKRGK